MTLDDMFAVKVDAEDYMRERPDEDRPGMVRRDHPAPSRLAALRVAPKTGTARWRILRHLRYGDYTDAELQEALRMPGNTQRPRRVELVRGGWVRPSGLLAGNGDTIWTLTERGRAFVFGTGPKTEPRTSTRVRDGKLF